MAVKVKIHHNIGVIKVKGTLIGDEETREVHQRVKDLIEENIQKIVMDLSKVKWMNSHGLGVLMACYSSVYHANGKIAMTAASEKVKKLMAITKVHTLFDHFDSINQALDSYR